MSPDPEVMPLRVLRARGALSPLEAVVWWLVRDPGGPGVSQAEAGRLVGVRPGNVWTVLRRAEEKRRRR